MKSLGSLVWAPKPVYRSPKRSGYDVECSALLSLSKSKRIRPIEAIVAKGLLNIRSQSFEKDFNPREN